ncbi:hypothetical protein HJC23_009489 [Cyclotella cryptica]|uniref:Methyltransferase domain-containing protein n=1 Tax=Cyclotella cryptica TaxID=29204 RepID=A0ABD3P7A0_9STRA|eukprot:CCRYP_017288-RA/>CCRYP_017288-RA protein AED:0.21 eAED:0.21 QI:0/-1/0/1/-1/1/1/0/204
MSSAAEYYASLKTKWAKDYQSSDKIEETWNFYKECGYENPQATLRSMIEPVTFSQNRILDYGCDKGLILKFFCDSLNGNVEGHGVDINEEAILYSSQKFPSFTFKVCDGLTLEYPDKYFDLVIVIATIKHVRYEDRSSVYSELNRVAEYVLLIEADETEERTQIMMGWTFYNSNFAKEFSDKFAQSVKVVREAGDILGLYKCKE